MNKIHTVTSHKIGLALGSGGARGLAHIGVIKALEENKRPSIHVKITKNDEFHLGMLILFFESLTALMGEYLKIDPFDQPGVEAGKIYAFEFLSLLK